MALTRITKGVIKPNENYDTHNINSTGIITATGGNITGNLTVGGVLTYEDVTSIDSVGIITAQKDIHVGAGVSAVGVGTFGTIKVGTGVTIESNGNSNFVGVSSLGTGATGAVYLYNPDADALSGTTNDIYGWKAKTYADGLQVNSKLYLSRSGSNGLSLAYNNATGSYITANSGFMNISVPHGPPMYLRAFKFYLQNGHNSATFAEINTDAAANNEVKLFYGNVKKFETVSSGVNVVGTTTSTQLAITGVSTFTGTSNLSRIESTATSFAIINTADRILMKANNRIDLADNRVRFQSRDQSTILLDAVQGSSGFVKLYQNNDVKLETTPKGIVVGTGVTVETNGQSNFSGISTYAKGIYITEHFNYHQVQTQGLPNLDMPFVLYTHGGGSTGISTALFTGGYGNRPEVVFEQRHGGNFVDAYPHSAPWKVKWTMPNDNDTTDDQVEIKPVVSTSGALAWLQIRTTDNSNGLRNTLNLSPSTTQLYVDNNIKVMLDSSALHVADYIGHLYDTNTRIGFPGNDTIRLESGGTTAMNIYSNGIYLNTLLAPNADSTHDIGTNTLRFANVYADTYYGDGSNLTGIAGDKIFEGNTEVETIDTGSDGLVRIKTEGVERLRIKNNGDIGIGNFSSINPARKVHLHEASANTAVYATFTNGTTGTAANNGFTLGIDSAQRAIINNYSSTDIRILCNGSERLRIDNAGRLSLGVTGSPGSYPIGSQARQVQAEIKGGISGNSYHHGSLALNCTNNNSNLHLVRSDNTQNANTGLGNISFSGYDGSDFHVAAQISGVRDAAGGNNDVPGRLVFLTTADGASQPTERLRITSSGQIGIGTATIRNSRAMQLTGASNSLFLITGNAPSVCLNRDPDDSTDGDRSFFGVSSVSNGFANGTAAGDTVIRGNSSGKLHLATNTSIRLSIASDGDTTFYGSNLSLTIGTLYIPDSLVHNGDNDTKIRFPSNDTITFETAGTEKLRIESGGALKMSTNNARIRMGSGHPFELYHNGTYSYISDNRSGGSDELRIAGRAVRILNQDSTSTTGYFSYNAAKLYYTNYEKLSTVTSGVNITGTVKASSPTSHRNYFINGACTIWQRANDSNNHSSIYTCDRWWRANNASRVQRSTTTPTGTGNGVVTHPFPFSMHVTSNGSNASIGQAIELTQTGVSQFKHSTSYTLSMYIRTASGTSTVNAYCYYRNDKFSTANQTNWSGSAGNNTYWNMGTATTTWQRFEKTFTSPAAPNANNKVLALEFNLSTSFYVTGLQFEEGQVATPFEYRDNAEELTRCQRYFNVYHLGTQEWLYFEGATSNHKWWQCPIPAGMRSEPSITKGGTCSTLNLSAAGGGTISSFGITSIDNGGAGGTTHQGAMGRVSVRIGFTGNIGGSYEIRHTDGWGNGAGWLEFDSEF